MRNARLGWLVVPIGAVVVVAAPALTWFEVRGRGPRIAEVPLLGSSYGIAMIVLGWIAAAAAIAGAFRSPRDRIAPAVAAAAMTLVVAAGIRGLAAPDAAAADVIGEAPTAVLADVPSGVGFRDRVQRAFDAGTLEATAGPGPSAALAGGGVALAGAAAVIILGSWGRSKRVTPPG